MHFLWRLSCLYSGLLLVWFSLDYEHLTTLMYYLLFENVFEDTFKSLKKKRILVVYTVIWHNYVHKRIFLRKREYMYLFKQILIFAQAGYFTTRSPNSFQLSETVHSPSARPPRRKEELFRDYTCVNWFTW